jgi:hypothetical protein
MPNTDKELTVESCLAELRELFPAEQHIGIRITLGWFAPNNTEKLARIVVSRYEWFGKTLNEAMAQVRAWKESQN